MKLIKYLLCKNIHSRSYSLIRTYSLHFFDSLYHNVYQPGSTFRIFCTSWKTSVVSIVSYFYSFAVQFLWSSKYCCLIKPSLYCSPKYFCFSFLIVPHFLNGCSFLIKFTRFPLIYTFLMCCLTYSPSVVNEWFWF